MGQAKANAARKDALQTALNAIDRKGMTYSRQIKTGLPLSEKSIFANVDMMFDATGEIGSEHCFCMALGYAIALREAGVDAQAVMGGAAWGIGKGRTDILEFGFPQCDIYGGRFHAWVSTPEFVIDPSTRFFSDMLRRSHDQQPFSVHPDKLRQFDTVLIHRKEAGFYDPINSPPAIAAKAHIYLPAAPGVQGDMWTHIGNSIGTKEAHDGYVRIVNLALGLEAAQ
jgi:hypothetical protein